MLPANGIQPPAAKQINVSVAGHKLILSPEPTLAPGFRVVYSARVHDIKKGENYLVTFRQFDSAKMVSARINHGNPARLSFEDHRNEYAVELRRVEPAGTIELKVRVLGPDLGLDWYELVDPTGRPVVTVYCDGPKAFLSNSMWPWPIAVAKISGQDTANRFDHVFDADERHISRPLSDLDGLKDGDTAVATIWSWIDPAPKLVTVKIP